MFGSIARFVTGKGREARAGMAKIENRDLMQAIVYGSFYVAAADGEVSEAELKKLSALISNMPALKGFGPELGDTMDRAEADFVNGGKRILRQNAEKELSDLNGKGVDALSVMNVMLTVAEADDGNIKPEEMVVLEKAAKLMGLDLSKIL